MKLEHFEMLLDLHGPDVSGWPEADSIAARSLLSTSAEARTLLDQAETLETMLSSYTVAEPSARLEAAILDLAPIPLSERPAPARPHFLASLFDPKIMTSAGMALASMAFGLYIGMSATTPTALDEDADAFLLTASASFSPEFWQETE
ncbi:hypothetical protein [Ponticaulis koreensis]|uniref:hypothetical protein n=1 Tax=Ponticaulis koreensis TaxID=1123045 RepID=UPI0003B32C9C|nr:hypothetical protein [Ponticaulis koreensis]